MGRPRGSKNKSKTTETKAGVPGGSALDEQRAADEAPAPSDDNLREAFRSHVGHFEAAKLELEAARTGMKTVKASLKAEGFTVKQVEDALLLGTPEGEAKIRERLAATVVMARWMGSAIGTQFNFDLDSPDRTPGVDRAADEGKMAAMDGRPCKSPYSPETEQSRAYIDAFNKYNWEKARDGGIKALAKNGEDTDVRPRHMQRRDKEAPKPTDDAFDGDGDRPAA